MVAPKRVLVIDDDRSIVRALTLRLQAAGYEPLTAFDARAGLELAAAERPDAIIMDMGLPDMDGLALLAQLRQRDATRRVPVLAVSGNGEGRAALHAGAQVFLIKPFRGEALVRTVEEMVDSACLPVGADDEQQDDPGGR